jgi:excisionase family DNA binding protein
MHDIARHVSVTRDTEAITRVAYTVDGAAEQVGVSGRQMWRWIKAGRIESIKIGGSRRVTHRALLDFVERESAASAAGASAA